MPLFSSLAFDKAAEQSFIQEHWESVQHDPLVSEEACLHLIDRYFPSKNIHVPRGRGHDCAELDLPQQHLAISTDVFLEDVHFRRRYATPAEIGSKALAQAISDIAAAGAIPLGFSLALMLPQTMPARSLKEVLQAMGDAAASYGIALTGGDISRSASLGFAVTVWGASVDTDAPFFLRRQQALPDDVIFLIGTCGLARTGLELFETYGRSALPNFPCASQAFLQPQPLLEQGATLARIAHDHKQITHISLMDVSDGLLQDLPRLLGKYGADIRIPSQTLAPELLAYAQEKKISPEMLFLQGGEDYALVGTMPKSIWENAQNILPTAICIGTVTEHAGVYLHGNAIRFSGFDHFAPKTV